MGKHVALMSRETRYRESLAKLWTQLVNWELRRDPRDPNGKHKA